MHAIEAQGQLNRHANTTCEPARACLSTNWTPRTQTPQIGLMTPKTVGGGIFSKLAGAAGGGGAEGPGVVRARTPPEQQAHRKPQPMAATDGANNTPHTWPWGNEAPHSTRLPAQILARCEEAFSKPMRPCPKCGEESDTVTECQSRYTSQAGVGTTVHGKSAQFSHKELGCWVIRGCTGACKGCWIKRISVGDALVTGLGPSCFEGFKLAGLNYGASNKDLIDELKYCATTAEAPTQSRSRRLRSAAAAGGPVGAGGAAQLADAELDPKGVKHRVLTTVGRGFGDRRHVVKGARPSYQTSRVSHAPPNAPPASLASGSAALTPLLRPPRRSGGHPTCKRHGAGARGSPAGQGPEVPRRHEGSVGLGRVQPRNGGPR